MNAMYEKKYSAFAIIDKYSKILFMIGGNADERRYT